MVNKLYTSIIKEANSMYHTLLVCSNDVDTILKKLEDGSSSDSSSGGRLDEDTKTKIQDIYNGTVGDANSVFNVINNDFITIMNNVADIKKKIDEDVGFIPT